MPGWLNKTTVFGFLVLLLALAYGVQNYTSINLLDVASKYREKTRESACP